MDQIFKSKVDAWLVTIRCFQHGDEPALWNVYFAAIHEIASKDYSSEQVDAWAPKAFDLEKWTGRMRAILPFVAVRDGAIVAYADVQPSGYIDHFFVSPGVA